MNSGTAGRASKALIAMSGGVDSSVAAYLTKKRGFDCVGVTMKLFSNEDIGIEKDAPCCSLKDTDDARAVAYALDIPHYVFNFASKFESSVIRNFVESYERGHTPNPCVDCNRYIKFGELLARAVELDCDFLVTGHYARIEGDEKGGFLLKKALDETKDQSYFLYSMTQAQLARTLFPLGAMEKKEVRDLALTLGLPNAKKHESQDICFVTGGYAEFIERYRERPLESGNFVDAQGKILGRHKGIVRYTVGQRKGLAMASSAGPLYVCAKNASDNTVTLGEERTLYTKTVFAGEFNWIRPNPEGSAPMRVLAKTRYRQTGQWATVGKGRETLVEFDEPQKAVAPGQALVLYDGDDVVGGGTILRTSQRSHVLG